MTDRETTSDTNSFEAVSTSDLDNDDKASLEYGKKVFVDSLDNIKSFAQSSITLISGLFTAYFVLLEFLNIKTLDSGNYILFHNLLVFPPVFFIVSIVSLILAVLPIPGKLSLNDLTYIKKDRRRTLLIKYVAVIIGMVFFIASLSIIVIIFLQPF